MIGREELQKLDTLAAIDGEIDSRNTRLNEFAGTIEPQILAEELAELRKRRVELEEAATTQLESETGCAHGDCKIALIKANWDLETARQRLQGSPS